jgi:choline dehydrogenase
VCIGMTYIRGDKAEFDAWETLGNEGWNWDTLFPYYKQVEHFSPPNSSQLDAGATYDPEYHGEQGPLNVSFPAVLQSRSLHDAVNETWTQLGFPQIRDANGGSTRGFNVWPMTIDGHTNVRADAAKTYYWPVAARPNLTLIKGTARRVIWENDGLGSPENGLVATGVEFLDQDGQVAVVNATREVILSAGSLRTPPILELSGVGNPRYVSLGDSRRKGFIIVLFAKSTQRPRTTRPGCQD